MAQEEEVLGKAYDARLMRRLLTYLRPYRWQTITALAAVILKSGADVVGPYITKTAIDKYLARSSGSHSLFDSWLSSNAISGIAQLTVLFVVLQLVIFVL